MPRAAPARAALAEKCGVPETEFTAHSGAFPLTVRGVGLVGVVTVSGLPQLDDHRRVVAVLRRFLAG